MNNSTRAAAAVCKYMLLLSSALLVLRAFSVPHSSCNESHTSPSDQPRAAALIGGMSINRPARNERRPNPDRSFPFGPGFVDNLLRGGVSFAPRYTMEDNLVAEMSR